MEGGSLFKVYKCKIKSKLNHQSPFKYKSNKKNCKAILCVFEHAHMHVCALSGTNAECLSGGLCKHELTLTTLLNRRVKILLHSCITYFFLSHYSRFAKSKDKTKFHPC